MLMVLPSGGHDAAPPPPRRAPTLAERFTAQRSIEEIHHRHRTWPASNSVPKPALDDVLSPALIRARVVDDLKKSAALERFWGVRLTGADLQSEMERMAARSRSPQVLRELFAALGDDPDRVAECLARPLIADRLLRLRYSEDPGLQDGGGFDRWWERVRESLPDLVDAPSYDYRLPAAEGETCAQDSWTETTSDTPEARSGHTVVWTGSEMIVWGGIGGGLTRGARYDPATDSWASMRDAPGAPTPRFQHTAVWTGTEMIIWGGTDPANNQALYTGGRYDPATDTWRSTGYDPSLTDGRGSFYHAAVWTGSEMFVCGGWYGVEMFYNPTSDSWRRPPVLFGGCSGPYPPSVVFTGSQILVWSGSIGTRVDPATGYGTAISSTNAPSPRQWQSTVWTGQAMVVWGGWNPGVYLNTGGRYYPATDTWLPTETAGAPMGRINHTAIWTGQTMVVWGGSAGGTFQTGGRYDPVQNTWQPTGIEANTPGPRDHHTAIWDGHRMIVWGGSAPSWDAPSSGTFNTGGLYDPVADSWNPTRVDLVAPAPREGHTVIWTGSEMIVWGGFARTDDSGPLSSGGRYDPATDSWTPTRLDATTPSARGAHTAVWTGREMIVWGGASTPTGGRYDPVTDTWRPTRDDSTTPIWRSRHTAVWTGMEMIVWGGTTAGNGSLDDGGRYDPMADTWRLMSPGGASAAGRRFHTAVWSGQEMIVFGGYRDSVGFLDSGGRYDPIADSWRALPVDSNSPTRRYLHTAVWSGREMIVWGGRDDTAGPSLYLNTGARYNPSTNAWTPTRSDTTTPSRRAGHSAVWTGGEMLVWSGLPLASLGDGLATGAGYDPVADRWAPIRSDTTVPGNRSGHTAVWSGNQMLVWGGIWSTRFYPIQATLNTGGAYCACPGTVSFYFQDADGDGHGDDSVWLQSCVAPAGYVSTGGDCNDASAAVWKSPSEARDLRFESASNLAWSPPLDTGGGAAVSYDLIRSGNARDFVTNTVCVVSDATQLSATDATDPLPGGAFYYLVGPENGCRDGSVPFGLDSSGNPISGRACP